MVKITGKTARLLNRLPHFYKPEDLGKTFLNLYDVFGKNLERCERDVFEVLKSHHVQTAENVGSKGYIAPPSEHGDLDKLFSLYLEVLGGTSQLVTMNPLFTSKSFSAEKLIDTLYDSEEPLYELIRVALLASVSDEEEPTADIVEQYRMNYLEFKDSEIQSDFVFALLMQNSPMMAYLAKQLDDTTNTLLFEYDGKGSVAPALQTALAKVLNEKVLKDPFLYQSNYDYFEGIPLAEETITLRNSLNKKFLIQKYKHIFRTDPAYFNNSQEFLNAALEVLDYVELPPAPVMNSLRRLNRQLLNQAALAQASVSKVWGFEEKNIPSLFTIREAFKQRLNQLINGEGEAVLFELDDEAVTIDSLFGVLLKEHKHPVELLKQYASDTKMLRRFLLESVFPFEVKHTYRAYQERLQALVKVLRKGASTVQGVKDIVAANFGLVGNDPDVLKAKRLIQIKEYDPKTTSFYDGRHALFSPFVIYNQNQDPAIPEIKITMLDSTIKSIRNLRFIDRTNNNEFTVPLTLEKGDSFRIQNGELIYNGAQSDKKIINALHLLPARESVTWELDAEILSNNDLQYGSFGKFGSTRFGDGIFINDKEPIVHIEVLSDKLTYGAFSIHIPWHIEGVTDNFAETEDHPRHKIKSLVAKVKAAGVRVKVFYLQDFAEVHDHTDNLSSLGIEGNLFSDQIEPDDSFTIDSLLETSEQHDVDDVFRTSGMFDYTTFGSGNTFGTNKKSIRKDIENSDKISDKNKLNLDELSDN